MTVFKTDSLIEDSVQYRVETKSNVSRSSVSSTHPFTLIAKPHTFSGYMNGFRQPVALLKLRIVSLHAYSLQPLQQALNDYLKLYGFNISPLSLLESVSCFAKALCAIQKASGLPIFEEVKIEKNPENENEFFIWIPMLFAVCFHPIAAFTLKFFNYHLLQKSFIFSESIASELKILIDTIKMHAPRGTNSLRLLQAAFEKRIPWRHVGNNTFQYGYGQYSCWLDSTFTDKTLHIPAGLVQNKKTITHILSQTGFPVPEHAIVNNEFEAISIAETLGYPVVIKPLDGRGGLGVHAHLNSANDVKKAFYATKKHTNTVLLEKHIVGKDYRLLVFNGKMIWAIERIPASVTGDGLNTIQTLIKNHNERYKDQYPLRHISFTDDTLHCLNEQGLTLETILPQGKMVVLSRIANISMGGTPVGVFDKVHPDNQLLVEEASKLLRLDLVGIDFISPDIQKSYRENGGKIIEANVQPQLGSTTAPHIYAQILSTLIPDQGRIFIMVVVGNSLEQQNLFLQLQNQLLKKYKTVGLAKKDSITINNKKIMDVSSLFSAGQHLLLRNDLDALIYHVDDYLDIAEQGLPFDCYDDLFLLEPMNKDQMDHFTNKSILDTLSKSCLGEMK